MSPEQAFNRKIKKFLSEQPESSASKTIRQIEKSRSGFESYYELFDNFAFTLGVGMIVDEIVNKNFRTIGYIPYIKYYPDNLLNEEQGAVKLIKTSSPLSLSKCYEHLAKGILYRLMRVPNLTKLIPPHLGKN